MAELEIRQGAFFPGEDGSITMGSIRVPANGIPVIGQRQQLSDLYAQHQIGLDTLGVLNARLKKVGSEQELAEIEDEVDGTLAALDAASGRRNRILDFLLGRLKM